jgi:hypothetical protein
MASEGQNNKKLCGKQIGQAPMSDGDAANDGDQLEISRNVPHVSLGVYVEVVQPRRRRLEILL